MEKNTSKQTPYFLQNESSKDNSSNISVKTEPGSTYISECEDIEFARLREEHQREIDLLSLELLSNSKQYKRYIAKNCPEEQLEHEKNAARLATYKSRVAGLFMELLEEYENLEPASSIVNNELQTVFKECVNKMIQHIEWTGCNRNSSSISQDDDEYGEPEDDVLFGHAYRSSRRKSASTSKSATTTDPFSFWGATIRKSAI